MRLPKGVPRNRRRSKLGESTSGTRSIRYPVRGWPFTRTPSARSRCVQRQTAERLTPICRAIFSPLMTIMGFSESNVSSASIRRSVVPARSLVAESLRAGMQLSRGSSIKLYNQRERHRAYPPRGAWAREGRRTPSLRRWGAVRPFLELGQPLGQLVELELAFCKGGFELSDDF